MKTFLLLAITCLIATVGCGPSANLSSPKAAVQTFAKAAESKNVDLLATCVHAECVGEFRSLLEKTTEDEMLDQLSELFRDAKVGDAQINGNDAIVKVKLTTRDEELTMRKSSSGWQLVDF